MMTRSSSLERGCKHDLPEFTLNSNKQNRAAVAAVYQKHIAPFLTTIESAKSQELLVRNEDVQVLNRFETEQQAKAYLESALFT